MEKRGHLLVTARFAGGLPLRHRLSLKLGCVLPDLLVHTYAVGHTWMAARDRVEKRMRRLAGCGHGGCWSYLMLGYILHYVEDFFTWPHNAAYPGNLADHVRYERGFTKYLLDRPLWDTVDENKEPAPVDLIVAYLRWLHDRYEAETPGQENDCRYIARAAALVAHSYCGIFHRNRLLAGAAVEEDLAAGQVYF